MDLLFFHAVQLNTFHLHVLKRSTFFTILIAPELTCLFSSHSGGWNVQIEYTRLIKVNLTTTLAAAKQFTIMGDDTGLRWTGFEKGAFKALEWRRPEVKPYNWLCQFRTSHASAETRTFFSFFQHFTASLKDTQAGVLVPQKSWPYCCWLWF